MFTKALDYTISPTCGLLHMYVSMVTALVNTYYYVLAGWYCKCIAVGTTLY